MSFAFASPKVLLQDEEADADNDFEIDDDDMEEGLGAMFGAAPPPQAPSANRAPPPPPAAAAPRGGGGLMSGIRNFFGGARGGSAPAQSASWNASRAARQEKRKKKKAMHRSRPSAAPARFRRHRVDTNVVSLKLGALGSQAGCVATGDPEFCSGCGAAMSVLSKVHALLDIVKAREGSDAPEPAPEPVEVDSAPSDSPPAPSPVAARAAPAPVPEPDAIDLLDSAIAKATPEQDYTALYKSLEASVVESMDEGDELWMCEFCDTPNVVTLDEEEKPQKDTIDYVLQPPQNKKMQSGGQDARTIIFVVDVSGSMCVTQEVQGKFELKGDRSKELADIDAQFEPQHGMRRHQPRRRNVTYVSRLQAVQAAVDHQLEYMKSACPNYRVGLVTFAGEVAIIGDGTSPVEVITGDKLQDQAQLQQIGEGYALDKPISETRADLSKKLFALQENGPTALGPAMVAAIAMAGRAQGSKVVLCTDGVANVGLGSLDELTTDAEKEEVEQWYQGVGNFAALKGVTVSVLSITDAECSLENLGKVADLTHGDVDRVNPLELTKNFSSILANPVIATNVSATMLLHKGLQFRDLMKEPAVVPVKRKAAPQAAPQSKPVQVSPDEPQPNAEPAKPKPADSVNRKQMDVGNATSDSEIFFEYSVRKDAAKEVGSRKTIPFQVQIHYTRLDGARCVRVLSQSKEITKSLADAEKQVDVRVMAAHAAQQSAFLAEVGDYDRSRVVAQSNALYMDRVSSNPQQQQTVRNYVSNMHSWDGMMQSEQRQERERGVAFDVPEAAGSASARKSRSKARSRRRQDHVSSKMYSAKKATSSMF